MSFSIKKENTVFSSSESEITKKSVQEKNCTFLQSNDK